MNIPASLQRIAQALPCPLYLVGGWVRNTLLYGRADSRTDMDVCGPMLVSELKEALQDTPVRIVDVNPRIGTVQLSLAGDKYEYTTFRRDSYPIGGVHTPTEVTFVQEVAEDALRRDFRANAIYVEVLSGEIVDPLDGRSDLSSRTIRTTRSPDLVFAEDGLRILRMVRFCAQLAFSPDRATFDTAKALLAQLDDISPERKWGELEQILLADSRYDMPFAHDKGLALLDQLGIWPHIAPLAGTPTTEGALRFYPVDRGLRLAGLCRCLAKQTGQGAPEFAQDWLGQKGLRCSKAIQEDVQKLLAAERDIPEDEGGWRLWAATYREDSVRVGYLWNDLDRGRWAASVWRTMQQKRIPLCHKDLPLTPAELCQMGIPQSMLGKVYAGVLRYCQTHLCRPTKKRCAALIRQVWKEKKWTRLY